MDPNTSAINQFLLTVLNDPTIALSDWERQNYPDILRRNVPVYSARQINMFKKCASRNGIDLVLPREADKTDDSKAEWTHCAAEPLSDWSFQVVDANGQKYGPPCTKSDLKVILPWFNEVLKQQQARRAAKKKNPPECPF